MTFFNQPGTFLLFLSLAANSAAESLEPFRTEISGVARSRWRIRPSARLPAARWSWTIDASGSRPTGRDPAVRCARPESLPSRPAPTRLHYSRRPHEVSDAAF